MAEEVKIIFEIEGIQQSVSSVEELQTALKGIDKQAKKTEKSVGDVADAAKDMGKKSEDAGKAGEGALKVMDEASGGLATKVYEVGGGLKAMGKQAVTAFKGAVMGANSMGKALIATGIGAIVVALGLIVAYRDDIVGAISGVSSEQKQLLADTQATADAASAQYDATSASENSLKLAGKSEREIRDLKIQETDEIIVATEAVLQQQKEQAKAQTEAMERNKSIAQNVIRFLTMPITILLATVDAMTAAISKIPGIDISTNLEEGFSGGLANMLFDPEETAAAGAATVAETEKQLAALKNSRDGFKLQEKDANAKSAKERADMEAELNAELERLRAENLADAEQKALALLELQRQTDRQTLIDKKASADLLLEFDTQSEIQRLAIVKQYQDAKDAIADAAAKKRTDDRAIVDAVLKQAELQGMEDAFRRAEAELELQRQTDIAKITQAGATADEIAKINQSYADKQTDLGEQEVQFNKDVQAAKVGAALDASSAVLGSIVSLVGEGSAIGKAAAISQTVIDTISSSTAAYKSVVGVPFVGPVLAPIAAGVAIAAGAMSVKKIMATKIPGNKSVSGGVPSIPAPPAYDPTAALGAASGNQTQSNQITLGNQTGSSGANVVKAYVVSSDMSSQQSADRKITDLARL